MRGQAPVDPYSIEESVGSLTCPYTVDFYDGAGTLLASRSGSAMVFGEGLEFALDKSMGRYRSSSANQAPYCYLTSDTSITRGQDWSTKPSTLTWGATGQFAVDVSAAGTDPYTKKVGTLGRINSYPSPITGSFVAPAAGSVIEAVILYANRSGYQRLMASCTFSSSYTVPAGAVYMQILSTWTLTGSALTHDGALYLLDSMCNSTVYYADPSDDFRFAFVDPTSFSGYADTDTMPSHPGWIEEVALGGRYIPTHDNAAAAADELSASKFLHKNWSSTSTDLNARGLFLTNLTGSTGYLWSATDWPGQPLVVSSGTDLTLDYLATITAG